MKPLSPAQAKIVADNIPLAKRFVHGLMQQHPRLNTSRDDFLQAAYFGLMRAAAGFKPDRGMAYSTYAVWCMRSETKNHLRRMVGPVAIPFHDKVEGMAKVYPVEIPQDDSLPQPAQIGPVGALAFEDARDAAAILAEFEDYVMKLYIQRSPPEQRKRNLEIFRRYRFGEETFDAIGQDHGLTRERVRQIVRDYGRRFLNFTKDRSAYEQRAHAQGPVPA